MDRSFPTPAACDYISRRQGNPPVGKMCTVPLTGWQARLKRSENQRIDQTEIEVNIYQGEDKDALNNIAIGQFVVAGLSDVPSGNPMLLSLVEKAKRLMVDASADDREDLVDQIELIHDAIKAGDYSTLRPATDDLSDLVYYLET